MKFLVVFATFACAMTAFAADSALTVHLLDHTKRPALGEKFWIDWSKEWRGIVKTKRLAGAEADQMIALLRSSLKETEAGHFCGHDPIYGIVATGKDGKVLNTSLCFTCLTWVKPDKRLNIDGKPGPENELCQALRKVIELPEELRKDQGKK